MRISNRNSFCCIAPTLAFVAYSLVAAVAVILSTCSAQAADTLAYSFEPDLEGFEFNGAGTTVTQDTIGATEGTHSMKVSIVSGATFVGAVTPNLIPGVFGDPPGLDHVTFDLTLAEEFGPADGTGFAVIGVTVFGQTQDGTPADTQIDLSKELNIGSRAVGTYHDVRIDLDAMVHPVSFEVLPFDDIFGTLGSSPDDIIPNSFQFYFNKTGSCCVIGPHTLTLYIDNVRFGTDPDAVEGDYNGNFVVDAADYTIWRDTLGSTTDLRANGDDTGGSLGVIDAADYAFWKSQFGLGGGSGSLSSAAVPEPASALLLVVALACMWGQGNGRGRGRTVR
jgi:hypothetical protein